jgi:hypothetical protein
MRCTDISLARQALLRVFSAQAVWSLLAAGLL